MPDVASLCLPAPISTALAESSLPMGSATLGILTLLLACSASAFVVCEAGTYSLKSGGGPIVRDPNCNGTHCDLHIGPLATLQVSVSPRSTSSL